MVTVEREKTREAGSVERTKPLKRYVAVGLAAVAIGVGSVLGANNLFGDDVGEAQQAAQVRGSLVDQHLESIWASGLAQQEALRELDQRRDFMRAWTMRGEEMADHVDVLIQTGLAQQEAMERR